MVLPELTDDFVANSVQIQRLLLTCVLKLKKNMQRELKNALVSRVKETETLMDY